MTIIVGQQNVFTSDWSVTTGVGTLTISDNTLFDLGLTDIARIYDVTQDETFYIDATTTFSSSFVDGKPVYTWVFNTLPSGVVTADTLLIYINVSPLYASLAMQQYQAAQI